MPLYDFKCKECNAIEELLVSSDSVVECAQCGGECERLLSRPGGFQGLPTPNHSAPPREYDEGFIEEYESIWSDEPTPDV